MVRIITPGRKPEPPTPWYLQKPHDCLSCGALFQLEARDFDVRAIAGLDRDPEWKIIATARTPNGEQIIEGPCPFCKETVRITGRMGMATGGVIHERGVAVIGESSPFNGGD